MSLIGHEVERREWSLKASEQRRVALRARTSPSAVGHVAPPDVNVADLVPPKFAEFEFDKLQQDISAPTPIKLDLGGALTYDDAPKKGVSEYFLLEDLLNGNDEGFIRQAYLKLLKRWPDESGFSYYLDRLKRGIHRVDVLGAIYRSPEVRRRAVKISGLQAQYALQKAMRWPFFGGLVRLLGQSFALPRTSSYIRVEALMDQQGEAFVREAYSAVLGRAPDAVGFEHYLERLNAGASKISVIRDMRKSQEGRAVGAYIGGFGKKSVMMMVGNIPIVGRFVKITAALWMAPENQERIRVLESQLLDFRVNYRATLHQENNRFESLGNQLQNAHNDLLAFAATRGGRSLQSTVRNIEVRMHQEFDAIKDVTSNLVRRSECEGALSKIENEIRNTELNILRRLDSLDDQTERALVRAGKETRQALSVLEHRKADAIHIEALKKEISTGWIGECKRIESKSIEAMHALRRALDSKAGRVEVSALTNHLVNLVQARALDSDLTEFKAEVADEFTAQGFRLAKELSDLATVMSAQLESVASMIGARASLMDLESTSAEMQFRLTSMKAEVENIIQGAIGEIGHLTDLVSHNEQEHGALKSTTQTLNSRIDEISARMHSEIQSALAPLKMQSNDLKVGLIDQQRRTSLLLDEARKRLPEPISTEQIEAMISVGDHALDALYATFEDRFRGTRKDITDRLSIYVPMIREANAGVVDSPVIDLGCGRGEWLELLRAEGLDAFGVDMNRVFLDFCRDMGLKVHEADAVSYLKSLKSNSVGAITAFHLIEHIPHRDLISLIDEILRVLRPGGVVVFETPNPKNILVGSCSFYLDPTHRNPLPPELSQYLLEARGFNGVYFEGIHPFEPEYLLKDGPEGICEALNSYLFSARDYFVFGRKS
ncbi:DUF4214 domain-containing protein [Burkholderia contaminans]|uniref:DUF4214 domain-containing protein n=1 Tax=Burkholderia contaminans TaxID=488447 RepID=UPI001452B2AD|nr:DUF4214 domain-containing protein [Burkholderia contaminans]MCA8154887.1 DUF4214 domain-containing protein [Burkholderia contaminans]VWD34289.1 methyltransferase type 11 [Burkholderia contaminans]